MKFFISDSPGSAIFLLSFKSKTYGITTLSFLVDEFKFGLKDFQRFPYGVTKVINEYSTATDFNKVRREKFTERLARGYHIAQVIGTPHSPELRHWIEQLGLMNIKPKGSLYRCYKCGVGNLPDNVVNAIIEVSRRELREGTAGTPFEELLYILCPYCQKSSRIEGMSWAEEEEEDIFLEMPDRTEVHFLDTISSLTQTLSDIYQPSQITPFVARSLPLKTDFYKVMYRHGNYYWLWPLVRPEYLHTRKSLPIDVPTHHVFHYSNDEEKITLYPKELTDVYPFITNTPLNHWRLEAKGIITGKLGRLSELTDEQERSSLLYTLWMAACEHPDLREFIHPTIFGEVIHQLPAKGEVNQWLIDEQFIDIDGANYNDIRSFKSFSEEILEHIKKTKDKTEPDAIRTWLGLIFSIGMVEFYDEAERIIEIFKSASTEGRLSLSFIVLQIANQFPELVLPVEEELSELVKEGDENVSEIMEGLEDYRMQQKDFIPPS